MVTKWKQLQILFSWAPISLQMMTAAMKLKDTCSLEGKLWDKPRQHIKMQGHQFPDKGPYSLSYGFSSSHVQMWELDHKEGWVLKKWCFQIVVLVKTLERPLDCKEIKPVNPKGNQSLGGLMLKLKPQYFGHLMQTANSLEKSLMLGRIEGRRRRGWQRMRWLDGMTDLMYMSLVNSRDGEGQGTPACCSPWGHKEPAIMERLDWTELNGDHWPLMAIYT